MRAPMYTVQKIDPLPGCDLIRATAMNNWGQVVGICLRTGASAPGPIRFEPTYAFFWHEGRTSPLHGFTRYSYACDINDRGDVVGHAEDEQRTGLAPDDRGYYDWPVLWVGQPAVRRDRSFPQKADYGQPDERPLRLPGIERGAALAINEQREVVGTPAALWRPASSHRMKLYRQRLPEKGKAHRIVGIDPRGRMIAVSEYPLHGDVGWRLPESHAFWGHEGRWSRLTTPGRSPKADGTPLDINNAGVVVGTVEGRPWVWRDGKGAPMSEQEGRATGVNDAGAIVGYGVKAAKGEETGIFACLWQDGRRIDLNDCVPRGTYLASAEAINNRGQILVNNEGEAAYLLTPR